MTLSLNEVEATAKKAVRGAGYSWGLAEEAGKATRWLCARDIDGCRALANLLDRVDGIDQMRLTPALDKVSWIAEAFMCPLMAGVALSDRAEILSREGLRIEGVTSPILLAPFAAYVAQSRELVVTLAFAEASVSTDGDTLCSSGDPTVGSATVSVRLDGAIDGARSRQTRANPDPSVWNTLNVFAHRTYAPATEESRLKGAGAGLSDND